MGGVIRGIGRAIGGVARGVGSVVGGVWRGAGKLLKGDIKGAFGSVVGGVWKGVGHVVKGGLGAVKEVLGDPLTMGLIGFGTFGIGGAIMAPMLGKMGAGLVGGLEHGVGQLFGINGKPACQSMCHQQNCHDFGPWNGGHSIAPGGCYPQPTYPSFPPYMPNCPPAFPQGSWGVPNYGGGFPPGFPGADWGGGWGGQGGGNTIHIHHHHYHNGGGCHPVRPPSCYGCTPCCSRFC